MGSDLLTTITSRHSAVPSPESAKEEWDKWLLLIVFLLVALGLVMLYSASAVMAEQRMGGHLTLLQSQLQKVTLGVVLLVGALRVDYRWYQRLIYPILGVTFVLLILVLIPGIGAVQNGSRRWFSLGGMSFQPAEVAKLSALMYLSYSVSKKGKRMGSFSIGMVPHIIVIGAMGGFLMLQPDFGSTVILMSMMMILMFVSGAKLSYLFIMTLVGATGAYFAISGSEYRMKRIMAFLDPWSHRQDIGYQISESLIAVGASGLQGRGLGNGTGKLGYVPELWNDFIGTIIAEELGILGVVLLAGLFMTLIWRGLRIALRSNDAFGMYLAFGITAMFGLQGMLNLWVVTGMLPTKGLTLPFVSFGGSSMLLGLFSIGVLLNISRNAPDRWELERDTRDGQKAEQRWERKRAKIIKARDRRR